MGDGPFSSSGVVILTGADREATLWSEFQREPLQAKCSKVSPTDVFAVQTLLYDTFCVFCSYFNMFRAQFISIAARFANVFFLKNFCERIFAHVYLRDFLFLLSLKGAAYNWENVSSSASCCLANESLICCHLPTKCIMRLKVRSSSKRSSWSITDSPKCLCSDVDETLHLGGWSHSPKTARVMI